MGVFEKFHYDTYKISYLPILNVEHPQHCSNLLTNNFEQTVYIALASLSFTYVCFCILI